MKVEPIHHVPMRTEYKSPFSAAYSIEGVAAAPAKA